MTVQPVQIKIVFDDVDLVLTEDGYTLESKKSNDQAIALNHNYELNYENDVVLSESQNIATAIKIVDSNIEARSAVLEMQLRGLRPEQISSVATNVRDHENSTELNILPSLSTNRH